MYSNSNSLTTGELIFHNEFNLTIYVKIIPISFIFNGYKEYSLVCKNPITNSNILYRYEYNGSVFLKNISEPPNLAYEKHTFITLPESVQLDLQHDYDDHEINIASIGFGKYKLIFSKDNEFYDIIDTLTLEYDNNQGIYLHPDVHFFIKITEE